MVFMFAFDFHIFLSILKVDSFLMMTILFSFIFCYYLCSIEQFFFSEAIAVEKTAIFG